MRMHHTAWLGSSDRRGLEMDLLCFQAAVLDLFLSWLKAHCPNPNPPHETNVFPNSSSSCQAQTHELSASPACSRQDAGQEHITLVCQC
jgi:hypothetical protein